MDASKINVKPFITKSVELKQINYDICNLIFRNDYDSGVIISESGAFLDELSIYMTSIKIPNIKSNRIEDRTKSFFLIDKHNMKKSLSPFEIDAFNNVTCPVGYTNVFFVFTNDYYSLSIRNQCEYSKLDLSKAEIPLHLKNNEIKEMFLKSFRIAENELDICSPWINTSVVNNHFIRLLTDALYRNVTVKILYGLDNNSSEYNILRSAKSDEVAEMLKKEFSEFLGKTFFIKRDNIHYKVVLCDEKFKLEGSYNYLSFDGDYSDNSVRKEGSPFGTNVKEIQEIRRHYFENLR